MKLTALIFMLFCVSGSAFAEVYKWVDEDGVTHFGQKPPAAGKAETVNVAGHRKNTGINKLPKDAQEAADGMAKALLSEQSAIHRLGLQPGS